MEHEMRETFDALRAPEEEKDRTRAAVARQIRRRKRLRPLMAAACFAVVVVTLGGWRAYFTPAAVISVDINPSVELEVNRFDRVLSLEGLGDDGEALAAALNVRFRDYRTALEEILSSGAVTECLAQGEELSIAVVDLTGNGSGELLSGVEACAAATPAPTATPRTTATCPTPTAAASPTASTAPILPSVPWIPPSRRRRSRG